MTESIPESMTFEDFNHHIDDSEDEGCGICFSFHHYKHLDMQARKVAYLGWEMKEGERVQLLADELDRRAAHPIDENVYFLIKQAELLDTSDLALRERIMRRIIERADQLIKQKSHVAWVAVRAYAWMVGMDPVFLITYLDQTDDLDVWQVCLQCVPCDAPHYLGKDSLSLAMMRRVVYEYTNKALDIGDAIKSYVVAVNGVKAMCALQDPRVLEVYGRLPKHSLDRIIVEDAQAIKKYLLGKNDTDFIQVLDQIKDRRQL